MANQDYYGNPRTITTAQTGDPKLGPFKLLPGVWKSLPGRGWNMIALPFAATPASSLDYRLLLNQYNEELKFEYVDDDIPNRGVFRTGGLTINTDQFLVALDYEQTIVQIDAEDNPPSGLAGGPNLAIHHEPGLWLHMHNELRDGLDLARLATIPHGDSVLALGRSSTAPGGPVIPDINGLPEGVNPDVDNNPYLLPYKHFRDNLFNNLFDPTKANDLLKAANVGVDYKETTTLTVDTDIPTGGIVNIPFVVKQANATTMRSHFWISELNELDEHGHPKLRLQYSQLVMLDFFPRRDGVPGLIRWPHISINTLEKVCENEAPRDVTASI